MKESSSAPQQRPRLSIGIPTYNFGSVIGQTLASIAAQLEPGVEVVILDGGSTDQTETVVAEWRRNHGCIRYHRQPARGGIDRDMARVVELAQGDYCWLFSADDIMRPGALRTVLERSKGGADLLLLTHSNCTFDMRVVTERHPVLDGGDTRFDIRSEADRHRYFELARTSEAFFSFMSGLVVRRDVWRPEERDDAYDGTCWAHAAHLLRIMARRGLVIDYLADTLLDRRGENDSFGRGGIVKRFALAIDGYQRIVQDVFGPGSPEARHIRRALRAEFTVKMLLYAKLRAHEAAELEDGRELERLVASIYRDGAGARLKGFLVRATPSWALPRAHALSLRTRKVRSPA